MTPLLLGVMLLFVLVGGPFMYGCVTGIAIAVVLHEGGVWS